ncbi:MAG TPA: hypothetical protein VKU85_03550, partial [bacterium]|nr:hypothetical protein [bacterium]
RAADTKALMGSSLSAPTLAQHAVPQFFGDYHTLEKHTYWGEVFNEGKGPFFLSISFGVVALVSAAAGLAGRPRCAWPLAVAAGIAFLLAMGRHLAPLRPLLLTDEAGWFRWPVKLTFAAALVLPPLAAMGWSALAGGEATRGDEEAQRRSRASGRAAMAAAAAALVMGVAALRAAATLGDPSTGSGWLAELVAPVASAKDVAAIGTQTWLRLLRTAGFAGAAAAMMAAALFAARRGRPLRLAAWILPALVALELAPPQRGVNRGTPVAAVRDDAPVLRDARLIAAEGYRVEFPRYHWDITMPRLPDLPDEWWPRQRLDRELGNHYTAIGEGVPMVFLNPDRLVSPGAAERGANHPSLGGREQQIMARLLGVRGRVVAGRAALLGDRPPYPTIAGYPVTVSVDSAAVSIAAWLESLPDLEGKAPWQRDFLRTAWGHVEVARDAAAVRIAERHPGRWKLEVTSIRPGWVTLTETADPGWRARVDGERAEIVPYLADFQAVRVPAGKHLVEWDYRPRGFGWLLALGAAGAAGVVGLAVRGRRRDDPANG